MSLLVPGPLRLPEAKTNLPRLVDVIRQFREGHSAPVFPQGIQQLALALFTQQVNVDGRQLRHASNSQASEPLGVHCADALEFGQAVCGVQPLQRDFGHVKQPVRQHHDALGHEGLDEEPGSFWKQNGKVEAEETATLGRDAGESESRNASGALDDVEHVLFAVQAKLVGARVPLAIDQRHANFPIADFGDWLQRNWVHNFQNKRREQSVGIPHALHIRTSHAQQRLGQFCLLIIHWR